MARPVNTTRVVFSGYLAQGESFAWGFWLDESPTSQEAAMTEAEVLASYFQTYGGGDFRGMIMPDCGYNQVDVYGYPNAGSTPAEYHGQFAISPGVGTGVGPEHPLQCALVFTHTTPLPGASFRGRSYLPINSETLIAHQLSEARTLTYCEAMRHFLQEINDSGPGIPGRVAVVSPTKGLKTPITGVTCDSRLDVQRRRAEQEAELWQAAEVIVP